MKIRNLLVSCFFLWLVAGVSSWADAATFHDGAFWLVCNECSRSEREGRVRMLGSPDAQGSHDVYVLDLVDQRIFKFELFVRYEPRENLFFTAVRETTVEATVKGEFDVLIGDIDTLAEEIMRRSHVTIPYDVAGSAFDVLRSGYYRNAVGNYMTGNLSWYWRPGSYTLVPVVAILGNAGVYHFLVLEFADGSTLKFQLTGMDFESWELYWDYREGTAVDSEGNPIPESEEEVRQFEGRFSSQSAADAMVSYINSRFSLNALRVGYGGSNLFRCWTDWTSERVVVTCQRL
jgi:hypothetical protein